MLRKLILILGSVGALTLAVWGSKVPVHAQVLTPMACPSNSPGPVGINGGTGYRCSINSLGQIVVQIASMPPITIGGLATPAPPVWITTNTATVVKNAPGVLLAIANISTAVQPAGNCTWYDNASAASGNQLYIETAIGPGQVVTFGTNGFAAVNGITVLCAVAPSGAGILVEYQ